MPLDALSDAQLVSSAIVAALGLRDISGRSAHERLLDNLPGRSLLLVLDNFEQVVEAAPMLGELLEVASDVKAIVTSRTPLRLAAEQVYPVAPLPVPEVVPPAELAELEAIPSVHLFVERARRVMPGFALTVANAGSVAEICRHLDGLPLGIELAAARIPLLGPAGVLERLARHSPLGGVARRDAPSRHQSLQDTIAWSVDLLDEPGRTLLARLPVFAGGWRLEQAEIICGPADELGGEVVDVLAALVDQSLVTTDPRDDGVRFGMLETIRDVAARSSGSSESAGLRRRHAVAYLELAEVISPRLETHDARAAYSRLAEERDNLRAAVRYALEAADPALGHRLAVALGRFYARSGEIQEGSAAIDALLSIPGGEAPSVARMRGIEAAGNLRYYAGDRVRSRELYRAQHEMAVSLGDPKGVADARYNRAFLEYGPDEWEAALRELESVGEAFRVLGDERARARTLWARAARLGGPVGGTRPCGSCGRRTNATAPSVTSATTRRPQAC